MVSCGDLPAARKMLDDAKRMPDASNESNQVAFTLIAAIIRAREGDREPLNDLRFPNEANDNGVQFARGVLALERGDAEAAAAAFKRLADRQAAASTSFFVPLSHLYYARALAKLSRRDESRGEYERLFEIWKAADPDLPILVAAKKEHAALR
jgi:tetratricopeptide (TPR) repeat protein